MFSSHNQISRSTLEQQQSTEARIEQVHVTGNIWSEVNYTCTVEEIVLAEPHNFLLDGTNINDDGSNYEDEAEQEEIAEEFISYEEAPALEFNNVDRGVNQNQNR